MRVLVTGGAGYFGEIVVRRLLERGDQVRVLDIADNAELGPDVELIRGDVRDPETVRRALKHVDIVHHDVAQVPLAKNKREFWTVNVKGTRVVLEAAKQANVQKVVLVSSSAIYGVPKKNPVDRRTPPSPGEAYGHAKLVGERLAARAAAQGLDVTIVRPRTILGHGRLGIFQILFEWVRRSRPVYLLGSGHNRYQFVHADDLAAVCLLADQKKGPAVYLAGAERFGTLRELLEGLVSHAGSDSPVRSLPFGPTQLAMQATGALGVSPLGAYHALMYGRELFFDVSDTRRELGWEPRWSNAEMIADSYDYYVAHREEILARSGASHHRSPVKLGVLALLEKLP